MRKGRRYYGENDTGRELWESWQEEYDGAEKIAAIKAGADEYIRYPDTTEEWVASV